MRLPNNYEAVIEAAKEKHRNNEKLNILKPIATKIVERWDNLSETEKSIITLGLKDYEDFIEKLREIV